MDGLWHTVWAKAGWARDRRLAREVLRGRERDEGQEPEKAPGRTDALEVAHADRGLGGDGSQQHVVVVEELERVSDQCRSARQRALGEPVRDEPTASGLGPGPSLEALGGRQALDLRGETVHEQRDRAGDGAGGIDRIVLDDL